MNVSVGFLGEPALLRNSLILTGATLRTFSTVVSDCLRPEAFVHCAVATKSPLKASGPAVTLKVALTLAPGSMGPAIVADVSDLPATREVHCLGTAMLN